MDVNIHPGVMIEAGNKRKTYISLKAVNNGVRPIVVTVYGMKIVKYGTVINTCLKSY